MLKFSGLLLIILCGAGLGAGASVNLKRNTEICVCMRTFLSELGILIKYSGDTLFCLFNEIYNRQSMQKLEFLSALLDEMSGGTDFPAAWIKAVSSDKKLPPVLSELLLSLGESLGTSGTEGQLMSLERTQEELSAIYESLLEEYRRKGKLYRSIGLMGGITAALLLC